MLLDPDLSTNYSRNQDKTARDISNIEGNKASSYENEYSENGLRSDTIDPPV